MARTNECKKCGWDGTQDPESKPRHWVGTNHNLCSDCVPEPKEETVWRDGALWPMKSDTFYADRLWQEDRDKYNRCATAAFGEPAQAWCNVSPAQIQEFLQMYFDRLDLRLKRHSYTTGPDGCRYDRADVTYYAPAPLRGIA